MEDFKKNHQEDEIDLLELLQTAWNGRKTILKFIIAFFLIGLFVAIFSAKEYTASTVVVPQTDGEKGSSGLGGLAAMAGINLGGGTGQGIPPTLYPKIVQSVPFQRELLQVPLTFSDINKRVSYQEYYKNYKKFNLLSFLKKYTIGLPGIVLKVLRGEKKDVVQGDSDTKIYTISKEEKELFKQIQEQLGVDNNDKEGFVSLSFSMPEALPAAQMTQKAQELLQEAVTKFKIEKAQEELKFIEERCQAAKKEFDKKQMLLAGFNDRNRGLSTSRSQARLQRLQSDYNLAFGVYSELAKQLETQKIQVKKNTPIFTIIDPVSVPVEKSKPKRAMILVVWLLLGIVLGVGVVLGREWIKNLKENKK